MTVRVVVRMRRANQSGYSKTGTGTYTITCIDEVTTVTTNQTPSTGGTFDYDEYVNVDVQSFTITSFELL